MGCRPWALFFKGLRITIGLALVGWGIISFVIFILPGGLWTIILGLAILAIDFPFVKRAEERAKAWCEKKFPTFYKRVVAPIDRIKERVIEKLRSLFGNGKED